MRALLDKFSVFHHEYPVCKLRAGHSVRYHYTRFFSKNSENILKQPTSRKRVDRRGRLIKYKHLGIFAVCAGDNQALLFPSRQFNAVIEKLFAVRSVQTDIRDLFIHPRFFKRGLYQVISLVIIEDQILMDRKGVQNIILKYGSKFCLIGIKIVFPYVLSLVIDLAFRRIIKPQQQFYKGRFPRSQMAGCCFLLFVSSLQASYTY